MKKPARAAAERFVVYQKLGWLQRWTLRRLLARIRKDPDALAVVLAFEQALIQQSIPKDIDDYRFEQVRIRRSIPTDAVFEAITRMLIWYNREDQADLPDRVPHTRLPEFLSILSPILMRQILLDPTCRPLILQILHSGEDSGSSTIGGTIPWEDFRLEAARAIAKNFYLTPSSPEISDQITQALNLLSDVASNLGNQHHFAAFCREMAVTLGLANARALLDLAEDFQTCATTFERLVAVHQRWKLSYDLILNGRRDLHGLEQTLGALEALAEDSELTTYRQLADTYAAGTGLLSDDVFTNLLSNQGWRELPPPDRIKPTILAAIEVRSINQYLYTLWWQLYGSGRQPGLRWAFQRFTEHIPPDETTRDWTVDDTHNRRYWDYQVAEGSAQQTFVTTLTQHLGQLVQDFSFPEIIAISHLIARYCGVQTFTQQVDIPIAWEPDTAYEEGYNKYAGFYTTAITVARPTAYRPHVFTFEQPDLRVALAWIADPTQLRQDVAHMFRQLDVDDLPLTANPPSLQTDLARSLAAITTSLRQSLPDAWRIGLYGSWQRGDATPESDVDLVVFLRHDVGWFDATRGITPNLDNLADSRNWQEIAQRANNHRLDTRRYSISVVTPSMLTYYAEHGPIHLQNWIHALHNCHTLWER